MSMTQEEAIELLRDTPIDIRSTREDDIHTLYATAQMMAMDALRPVSREQVEKVWRGEWVHTHSSDNFWTEVWKCSHCDFEDNYGDCFDFCPFCGRAMTDEAVEIVMERLEALDNETQ